MTALQPDFLKVLTEDVADAGLDGATVLALIRYATAINNEFQGRMLIDGDVWWRASQADIGRSLGGVSHDTVRRVLSKLETSEKIEVCVPDVDTSRLKAYRLADLQLRDSTSRLNCNDAKSRNTQWDLVGDDAKSRNGYADSRNPLRGSASFTPPIEVKEEREARANADNATHAVAVPDSRPLSQNGAIGKPANNGINGVLIGTTSEDAEPAQYCRAHMPYGTSDSCGACKTARLNHESWFRRQASTRMQGFWERRENRQAPQREAPAPPRCEQPTRQPRRLVPIPAAAPARLLSPRAQQLLDEAKARGERQRAEAQERRSRGELDDEETP